MRNFNDLREDLEVQTQEIQQWLSKNPKYRGFELEDLQYKEEVPLEIRKLIKNYLADRSRVFEDVDLV